MSHDCLFCRISREEIPAHVIHQDSRLLAFLDIHPVRPGHVLIIPRQHYPYFEDMPADLAGHILNLGQRLARHMKRLYSVERVGFAFTGIHVAHAHAHLIPMHHPQDVTSTQYIEQKDLTFVMPPQSPPEQLASVAQDLRAPQSKGGSEDPPLPLSALPDLLGVAVRFGCIHFRTVNQLHESHGRVVALTEAHLQHAGIAAVAVRVARTDFGEQLDHRVAIAQTGKRQTLVREGGLLAQRDQGFDDAAQFFRLRQRGLDRFVRDQRNGHVAEHGKTVTAGAVELTQAITVTHDISFESKDGVSAIGLSGSSIGL